MTGQDPKSTPPSVEADHRTRQVEMLISYLLRIGVIASLVFMLLGTILSYVHHPAYASSPGELQQLTREDADFPLTGQGILTGMMNLQGDALITFGLLLLISTPIVRVFVSTLAFISQKDWGYTLITLGVLALLLLSFVLGKVE